MWGVGGGEGRDEGRGERVDVGGEEGGLGPVKIFILLCYPKNYLT